MAWASSALSAIGSGAQSMFGTSALNAAGTGLASAGAGAGAGSAVNAAMASGAPTSAMNTVMSGMSGTAQGGLKEGMMQGLFGTSEMSPYSLGQMGGNMLGQSLQQGSEVQPAQSESMPQGLLQHLQNRNQQNSRVNWIDTMSDQDGLINSLLSRSYGNG